MQLTPQNTSVFILAAGRGKRMMPLTKDTPKPLLQVAGKSLIEHQIQYLASKGFKHFVINIDYLGEQIIQQLGDGHQWDVEIAYSDERASGALETAGGIRHALPLIKSEHFLCINADIWTSFDIEDLLVHHQNALQKSDSKIINASLVLIQNPSHNMNGDFGLNHDNNNVLSKNSHPELQETYTFSGIACYRKEAFTHLSEGKHPLAPLLNEWCDKESLSGLVFSGEWHDVGTPERLEEINKAAINIH